MSTLRQTLQVETKLIRGVRKSQKRHCKCIQEFVIKYGQKFTPQQCPKKYHLGSPRMCFYNSTHLALKRDLVYVEGYAISEEVKEINFFTLHGWCVEKNSKAVIDITWAKPGVEFYGVAFCKKYVRTHFNMHEKFPHEKQCYSLLDDWRDGRSILNVPRKEVLKIVKRI